MKTTQEWFDQLPEDYRDKALKNMIDPTAQHYSLAGAISNGFVWEETPEGKDYWNGVFRELMYGEKFEIGMTIQPKDSTIESGLIESISQEEFKETPKIESEKEVQSEESSEEKAGNTPDLLKKYKKQKTEVS